MLRLQKDFKFLVSKGDGKPSKVTPWVPRAPFEPDPNAFEALQFPEIMRFQEFVPKAKHCNDFWFLQDCEVDAPNGGLSVSCTWLIFSSP